MLRVTTFNANGLRAAVRKGFYDWLVATRPDVVALQEVRARAEEIPPPPPEYRLELASAERAGYAGVGLLSRRPLRSVTSGFGVEEFDREGRLLLADLGPVRVASLYLPSGSQGPQRQASKDRFLAVFPPVLERWRIEGRTIVAGDFNIAHRAIDLRNAKSNEKNSGFLPHERAWMDRLFAPDGWKDTLRLLHPDTPGLYTWWTYRGQAWAKDVGWRIDYQIVTPELAPAVRAVRIDREARLSDHAPYTVDYEFD
jgi:exodeoxyribonuclease-3